MSSFIGVVKQAITIAITIAYIMFLLLFVNGLKCLTYIYLLNCLYQYI